MIYSARVSNIIIGCGRMHKLVDTALTSAWHLKFFNYSSALFKSFGLNYQVQKSCELIIIQFVLWTLFSLTWISLRLFVLNLRLWNSVCKIFWYICPVMFLKLIKNDNTDRYLDYTPRIYTKIPHTPGMPRNLAQNYDF